jgi:hypothetical protein
MSSLEDLLGSLTGGQTQTGAAPQAGGGGTGSLLATLAPIIANMLAGGGLQKILQQLQAKGRSNKASSWVSTGENQPLSADEVKEVVGEDQVRAAVAQAGGFRGRGGGRPRGAASADRRQGLARRAAHGREVARRRPRQTRVGGKVGKYQSPKQTALAAWPPSSGGAENAYCSPASAVDGTRVISTIGRLSTPSNTRTLPEGMHAKEAVMSDTESRPLTRTGRFLGLPYDWRRPTRQRLRQRIWNPDEPRVLVPKAYGWGYAINFAALLRRRARSTRHA